MATPHNIKACESVEQIHALLKTRKVIFWDFDGVVKDSVKVKSTSYEKLFLPFGEKVIKLINYHHEAHGGVSRYEKIPLYLGWAGESANPLQVQEFCDKFSNLVQQAVIDSPWVPGVHEYLKSYHADQCFILITATPQEEIERIINVLNIARFFQEVHGAPKIKSTVVSNVLKQIPCSPEQALVIGDSETDYMAARENSVAFLLRRTPFNRELQKQFQGPSVKNLNF